MPWCIKGGVCLSELVDEIQKFDAKEMEGEHQRKVKDFKKTRLHKAMQIFEEFVRALDEDQPNTSVDNISMQF
jgi:hypothetical protein